MGKKMKNKNTKIKNKEKEEKTKKTKEIKRQKEIEIGKEMEKEKKIKKERQKEIEIGKEMEKEKKIKKELNIENINVYYNIDNIIQENKEKLIELQKANKLNALLLNSYLNMSLDKKKKERETINYLKEKNENEESSSGESEISSKTSKKNKQPSTPSVDSSDTEGLKQKFEETKYNLKKIVEEIDEKNKNHYKKKYEFERKKFGPESERINYEVTTAIKKIEDANRKRREREERRKQTEKQFVICKECEKKLHPHSRNYHIFTSHNGKDLDKKIKQTCINRLISKKMDTVVSIMKEITKKKKEHGLEIQNANFVKIAQILNIEI